MLGTISQHSGNITRFRGKARAAGTLRRRLNSVNWLKSANDCGTENTVGVHKGEEKY